MGSRFNLGWRWSCINETHLKTETMKTMILLIMMDGVMQTADHMKPIFCYRGGGDEGEQDLGRPRWRGAAQHQRARLCWSRESWTSMTVHHRTCVDWIAFLMWGLAVGGREAGGPRGQGSMGKATVSAPWGEACSLMGDCFAYFAKLLKTFISCG